jgi:hypothetical protein
MKKATRFRNIFFLGKEGSGVCCETGRFRNTLKQCIDHLGVKRRILAEAARIFGVHPSTVCRLLAASAQGSHENDTRVPNIAERIRPRRPVRTDRRFRRVPLQRSGRLSDGSKYLSLMVGRTRGLPDNRGRLANELGSARAGLLLVLPRDLP